jgi:hypothetical protein
MHAFETTRGKLFPYSLIASFCVRGGFGRLRYRGARMAMRTMGTVYRI